MQKTSAILPAEIIEPHILLIRGHKVMLSLHLAALYGVEPRALVQAVKRNRAVSRRFQVPTQRDRVRELEITNCDFKLGRRAPGGSLCVHRARSGHAFQRSPEQAGLLVNIQIMRAFVRLRRLLASHAELHRRLDDLEKRCDKQFKVVFDAIRELMEPPETPKRRIGIPGESESGT